MHRPFIAMFKEFKEFAFKGSLVDVAVAFVLGGATSAFIGSFLTNLITPWLGLLGGANFGNLFMVLKDGKTPGPYASLAAATESGAVVLSYGAFLDELVKFLVLMFVMFLLVKAANKFKKAEEAAPAGPTPSETLLTEIRDLLKK